MILNKLSTKAPKKVNKEEIKEKTARLHVKLEKLHKTMRAECKHSMLIVLQGMDAAGKDSTVDKLYNGLYPMAVNVHSFKAPNEFEASKDYLWRIHNLAPSKGNIEIFNRSHYEDILVPTVHELLPSKEIDKRYDQINKFERMLEDNNTHVVKFYLHISKDEQSLRFEERATSLEKKWKYNSNDLAEAKLWDKYMKVYEKIFSRAEIKWDLIPADNKWYRDYLIAKKLVEILEALKMKYPNKLK
jgi:PPK2 family polyphosphate:nucleotide phosphotransferase